jgi:hypothetical protein
MSASAGLTVWQLAFQYSPIIMTGGSFTSIIGGALPVMAITEMLSLPLGLLGGGGPSTDKFFANYRPLPGATVVDQDIAHYPFANQKIAANAVIQQPAQISYIMEAPAQERFGMITKLAIMETLIAAFNAHNQAGGTYICATPSHIYINCVMKAMRDASAGATIQPQYAWQLDFEQPLVASSDAGAVQNGLMSLLSSGAPVPSNPSSIGWSGAAATALQPSIATPSVIPSSASSVSANTAGAGGIGGASP